MTGSMISKGRLWQCATGAALLIAPAVVPLAVAQTASRADHSMATWPLPDTVSAEGRAVAEALARTPMPTPLPPLAVQRQMIGAMQDGMGDKLRERYGVRVEAATIAGVPVRIVYPRGVTALGRGAVLLNLHGGGFTLDSGSLTETIPIAAMTGLPVIAVLYRLAPEHPYPAALDDALAVYRALEEARPATRIGVYGTSAGAILSGQLIARLASLHRPMPAALGFFSGTADLKGGGDSESWMPLPTGDRTMAAALGGYIAGTDTADPILSPIHSDLHGFPPTLLVSSTRDVLLSGTSMFGRALLEQGVDARLVVFDGLPHAFWAYMDIPESVQANTLMAKFLKERVTAR